MGVLYFFIEPVDAPRGGPKFSYRREDFVEFNEKEAGTMSYVDGWVLVVPQGQLKAYKKMAKEGGKMWKQFGALEYFECAGDDLVPEMGGMKPSLTFPKMTRLKEGETVIFAFAVYKSKAHRNQVNAKVMKEMAKTPEGQKEMAMPFDIKRTAWAGFSTIVEERP
ncbi:MAG: DUF1428 domain-containing protein [Deltaproteobacteria bacterium]|nr:DUF1428 domain-containing protein [Deltaproteobacteria bacterium]